MEWEESHGKVPDKGAWGGEQEPNFTIKVRGHYRTALSHQVPEAVMIRRRGSHPELLWGVLKELYSKAPSMWWRTSRRVRDEGAYLHVAEGARWGVGEYQEQGAWKRCNPGANHQPHKRQNEQLKGAPVIKQRWKKLKHNVIQEQLESYQNNREQLMENKLLLPHWNTV